jgi:flagellar motor switch protein FliN/FliY
MDERTRVRKAEFEEFSQIENEDANQDLDFLEDNILEIKFELGSTTKEIRDIILLEEGSIIKLDKMSGDNLDIKIKDDCIAKGEVVLLDKTYGVKITNIVDGD